MIRAVFGLVFGVIAAVLAMMAVGYIGFGIVFNLRRPWWGDAGRAAAAREAPTPPRVVPSSWRCWFS